MKFIIYVWFFSFFYLGLIISCKVFVYGESEVDMYGGVFC